jgi:hypothetical protein
MQAPLENPELLNLDDNIISQGIMPFMTQADRENIRQTCSRFRKLVDAQADSISVVINDLGDTLAMERLFKNKAAVRSVFVMWRVTYKTDCPSIMNFAKYLPATTTSLTIHTHNYNQSYSFQPSPEFITNVAQQCPNLTSFKLVGTRFYARRNEVYDWSQAWASLREVTDVSVSPAVLMTGIQAIPNLSRIVLDFEEEPVANMASMIPAGLQHLVIVADHWYKEGKFAKEFLRTIAARCTTLTTLIIGYVYSGGNFGVSDEEFAAILASMPPTLTTLKLPWASGPKVLEAAAKMRNLRTLGVGAHNLILAVEQMKPGAEFNFQQLDYLVCLRISVTPFHRTILSRGILKEGCKLLANELHSELDKFSEEKETEYAAIAQSFKNTEYVLNAWPLSAQPPMEFTRSVMGGAFFPLGFPSKAFAEVAGENIVYLGVLGHEFLGESSIDFVRRFDKFAGGRLSHFMFEPQELPKTELIFISSFHHEEPHYLNVMGTLKEVNEVGAGVRVKVILSNNLFCDFKGAMFESIGRNASEWRSLSSLNFALKQFSKD